MILLKKMAFKIKKQQDLALLIFSTFIVIAIIGVGGYLVGKRVAEGRAPNLSSTPLVTSLPPPPWDPSGRRLAAPTYGGPLPTTFPPSFIGTPPFEKSPEKIPEIPDIQGAYVEFPEYSFRVRMPDAWIAVEPSAFDTKPYFFENIQQVFVNKNNSCAILLSGDPSVEHGQSRTTYNVTFGNNKEESWLRSITANRDLLTSYAPFNPATTTRMTFLWGGSNEPYRPYEYLSLYLRFSEPNPLAFRVISTNENPLPEACELESRGIVKTLESTIANGIFPKVGVGRILVAEDKFEKTSNRGLFFIDTNTRIARKIFSLPRGADMYSFSPSTQDFYFSKNNKQPSLVRLHLSSDGATEHTFSAESGFIVSENSIISDFLPSDNVIYYLTGPTSCHDYRGQCSTTLYMYDPALQKTKTIATTLKRNSIVGVSKTLNTILLMTPFGDAGCWSRTFDRVHLSTGAVSSAGSFGGCEDYENPPLVHIETPEERGEAEVAHPYGGLENNSYILTWSEGRITPTTEPKSTPWADRSHLKIEQQFHLQSFPVRIIETPTL